MADLLVIRHGKSDWTVPVPDLERPLATRGRRAVTAMGRHLRGARLRPDLVWSSPAERAVSTARRLVDAARWDPVRVELAPVLYGEGLEPVLDRLRGVDDAVERLALVGHEPLSSMLIAHLVGGGRHRMPTAAVAVVRLDGPWAELVPGGAELRMLVAPKLLPR